VDLDTAELAPDAPLRSHVRGAVVAGSTRVPFDVRATLSRPAEGAGLGIAGIATLVRPDWRLRLDLLARGRPRLREALGLDRFALGADARFERGGHRLAFGLGVAGRLRYRGGLTIDPAGLVLRQGSEIPDLDAAGRLGWSRALGLSLDGMLRGWPAAWPTLPAPISRPRGPVAFSLDYRGPVDFSGGSSLALRSGATRLRSDFRLPLLLAWLDASARGTPLPPLDARVVTPRLDVPGMTLHGVEVEIDDGEP
jgi:hypothetical protein